MKTRKMIIAFAMVLATGAFTACTNDGTAEEDQLYEQGIDKTEIKEEDTRVFDIQIEEQDYQSIDKTEIKEEDT